MKNNFFQKTFSMLGNFLTRTFIITVLLALYSFFELLAFLASLVSFKSSLGERIGSWLRGAYEGLASVFDRKDAKGIKKINLIDLSIRNMKAKKVRTFVTVGGMTIGIAIIFFLVSVGYGIEELVISRVAKLEELRQIDVSLQPGSKLRINDESISKLKSLKDVEMALPVISAAGKVNFNNSVTDIAIYGVTKDYLLQSGSKPIEGNIFESRQVFLEDFDENNKASELSRGKELIINESLLNILGLNQKDAIGKKIGMNFIPLGANKPGSDEEKVNMEYVITGVLPENKNPFVYVPLADLREMGMNEYSNVKMIIRSEEGVAGARAQIEAMGYASTSIKDTIDQIDAYFRTVRTVLFLVGMVALGVAALGMFNTMTVSLLERTREIGLMKAIGLKSSEVYELFLTEALVMGIMGGFFGIVAGFFMGKLASLTLSIISAYKGYGYIDVTHTPLFLVLVIIMLSSFVGVLTGLYPSRRAEKISALNALRYE